MLTNTVDSNQTLHMWSLIWVCIVLPVILLGFPGENWLMNTVYAVIFAGSNFRGCG